MLLTVLLLGVGVSAVIYNLATPARFEIEGDKRTAAAMVMVRDALIGWSAARTPSLLAPNARPGELPCPDDNPLDGFEDGNCAAGAIGRVPWKTLGIPEPKDGSGETLWYAYSGSFRIWNTNPNPINSDTPGQLTINGTAPAANVIAIIFAPGKVLGAQDRSAAVVSLCATTGTNIERNRCAANYLEGENANGDTIYTTALASDAFNDKMLPLTSDALFNVVNVRVAKEAIAALETYRAANGYYPFANTYGTGAPYSCTTGLSRGRLPLDPAGCGQNAWAAGTIFEPNGWFARNNWNLVTHYAASKACGQFFLTPVLTGLGITTGLLANLCETLGVLGGLGAFIIGLLGGDDPVTVIIGGVPTNVKALVVVTGRAMGAQAHPCANAGECMEDGANVDGDAVYVPPSRFPVSNDRMAICVPSGAGLQCPSRLL